jgi:hypothetical protein
MTGKDAGGPHARMRALRQKQNARPATLRVGERRIQLNRRNNSS